MLYLPRLSPRPTHPSEGSFVMRTRPKTHPPLIMTHPAKWHDRPSLNTWLTTNFHKQSINTHTFICCIVVLEFLLKITMARRRKRNIRSLWAEIRGEILQFSMLRCVFSGVSAIGGGKVLRNPKDLEPPHPMGWEGLAIM